jgi:hypothetical protein
VLAPLKHATARVKNAQCQALSLDSFRPLFNFVLHSCYGKIIFHLQTNSFVLLKDNKSFSDILKNWMPHPNDTFSTENFMMTKDMMRVLHMNSNTLKIGPLPNDTMDPKQGQFIITYSNAKFWTTTTAMVLSAMQVQGAKYKKVHMELKQSRPGLWMFQAFRKQSQWPGYSSTGKAKYSLNY